MNKKKIVLLAVAGLIIIALIICIVIIKRDRVKPDNTIEGVNVVNTNGVTKEQTVNGLKFSKVSFVVINGETNFYALVTNVGETDCQVDNLYVNFLGDALDYKILGKSNTIIKAGDSSEIRLTIDTDLSNTKSVKYIIENAN